MANDVVWYHSDEVGAPTLNNAAGSLNDVLYACLVTGFRSQTLTSINVASNVATATLAGHAYTNDMMVDIAGASPGGLNGRKRITVTGSGTFTFPTTGVADGAATGTITAKRSPLGWSRVANSANKAIYARTDVAATAQVLCLDDTAAGNAGTTYARIVMAEAWTAADTFTGLAPTAAQLSGGNYISKGANSAAAKKWVIVGDSRFIYIFTETAGYAFSSSAMGLSMAAFGDLVSDRAGDAYGSIISAPTSSPGDTASGVMRGDPLGTAPTTYILCISRAVNQLGIAVRGLVVSPATGVVGAVGPLYPSPVNNGAAIHGPVQLAEENSAFVHPVRGVIPGLYHPMCRGMNVLHNTILTNVTGTSKAMLVVGTNSQGTLGAVALDTTGPWR